MVGLIQPERLHLLFHHLSRGLMANERIGTTEAIPEVVYLVGLLAGHSPVVRKVSLVQETGAFTSTSSLLLPRFERDNDLFPGLQVFQLDDAVRIFDFRICAASKARSFWSRYVAGRHR